MINTWCINVQWVFKKYIYINTIKGVGKVKCSGECNPIMAFINFMFCCFLFCLPINTCVASIIDIEEFLVSLKSCLRRLEQAELRRDITLMEVLFLKLESHLEIIAAILISFFYADIQHPSLISIFEQIHTNLKCAVESLRINIDSMQVNTCDSTYRTVAARQGHVGIPR